MHRVQDTGRKVLKSNEVEPLPERRASDDVGGLLPPIDSATRQVKSLDGLWDFAVAPARDPLAGFRDRWYDGAPLKAVRNI
jgi:beta-glucuronidase